MTTRPSFMQNRRFKLAATISASLIAGAIGHAIFTPEPVVAAALPVEFTIQFSESPAKYVGNQTAIAIGERCGLPIYLGEEQIATNEIDAEQARAFLAADPKFTDKVQITIGVKEGDEFKIVGADINCPGRTLYN